MVSAAHIVKKIIEEKPLLEEFLGKSLINYGGLADLMLPEIEKELKKPVKHSAVMMAIRRYKTKAEREDRFADKIYAAKSEIVATTGIFEVTIHKSPRTPEIIKQVHDLDVFSVVTGINEISVIAKENKRKKILQIFDSLEKKDIIKHIEEDLATITIPVPKDSVDSVGMFYRFTKMLAWENIPIIEVISTLTEASFVIKTQDLPRAIKALTK